ncbi:hypothetical protein CLF_104503 [Clonorchis sinensis]|uniref:Pol-related protein n=1 Tax=Clonorchis sinensis TaxID=79923 RepID=G7YNW1_CLOSI|nr:hypothetical protein CLF_104503 [Clonorchis sinensis]
MDSEDRKHMNRQNVHAQAFAVLRMIQRTFSRITRMDFQILYGAYVRPILEYANQVVYSKRTRDVILIERVQRAATKMVAGPKSIDYETRFAALDIFSLDYRRLFEQGLTNRFFTVDPKKHGMDMFYAQPHTPRSAVGSDLQSIQRSTRSIKYTSVDPEHTTSSPCFVYCQSSSEFPHKHNTPGLRSALLAINRQPSGVLLAPKDVVLQEGYDTSFRTRERSILQQASSTLLPYPQSQLFIVVYRMSHHGRRTGRSSLLVHPPLSDLDLFFCNSRDLYPLFRFRFRGRIHVFATRSFCFPIPYCVDSPTLHSLTSVYRMT